MIKAALPGLALIAIGSTCVLAPMYLPKAVFGTFAGDNGLNLVGLMVIGAIIAAGGALGTIFAVALHALRRRNLGETKCPS